MGRHCFQTSKIATAFKPAIFSFKILDCINYVSDPKADNVLNQFASYTHRTKFPL